MTGMIGLIVSLVSVLVGGYLLGKARGFRKGLRKSEETPLDGIKGGPLYRQVHSLLEEQRAEIVKLRNEVHTDWRARAEAYKRRLYDEQVEHEATIDARDNAIDARNSAIEELHNVNSALDAMNENLAARNDRCRYLESDRDALKQEVARLGKLVAEAREDGAWPTSTARVVWPWGANQFTTSPAAVKLADIA